MVTYYRHPNTMRRQLIEVSDSINGIDYLEVDKDDQKKLTVWFISNRALAPIIALQPRNIEITGGEPIARLDVDEATIPVNAGDPLIVTVKSAGDFSPYTLRLVDPDPSNPHNLPPTGIDPQYAEITFSFKVNCPTDFDCVTPATAGDVEPPGAAVNYLAKDYASFRQLMLDRLAVVMPDWQERNPADLGIALVELFAHTADQLSYFQDAVATEAYLGTARRRVSMRRHARLLDYPMHDGCNARAWICFDVDEKVTLPPVPKTTILGLDPTAPARIDPDNADEAIRAAHVVFETLNTQPITLIPARNRIPFYTWGDPSASLPAGATQATLDISEADPNLTSGDVLVFQEERGANTDRRHVVRLNSAPFKVTDTLVKPSVDALEISWFPEDALPFPLCLQVPSDEGGQTVAVAYGNVVLADHGRTVFEPLRDKPPFGNRPYRPRLQRTGLTSAIAYDETTSRAGPASAALVSDPRAALPAIAIQAGGERWEPLRDLLNSDRFAKEFVVEQESDGTAFLRFGDDLHGRSFSPVAGEAISSVEYRIGNGTAGNVGAGALTQVITSEPIRGVRNPLPAQGGVDPEPIDKVRLNAPQAFRTLARAVTDQDWAEVAQRHPEVQRAVATRVWTGSWTTIVVTVDRLGGLEVDADFTRELRRFLEPYRLAGYDLAIAEPTFVGLSIRLTVCVKRGYRPGDVRWALLNAFVARDLPGGKRGYFHPDNVSFGQSIFLSPIVAVAMGVPGVAWIDTSATNPLNQFGRVGSTTDEGLNTGRIAIGHLEIARVDNDPDGPERGRIDFIMQGST